MCIIHSKNPMLVLMAILFIFVFYLFSLLLHSIRIFGNISYSELPYTMKALHFLVASYLYLLWHFFRCGIFRFLLLVSLGVGYLLAR